MSRIWNIQAQIVTPQDVDLEEIEEAYLNLASERIWNSNYAIATLTDELDEED